jgi:CBS domain containing-hemolysin-like protein
VIWVVLVIVVFIAVDGLFAGAETGFYSVNRLRLRSRVQARWHGAPVLQKLLEQPAATMMTTLVWTNIAMYAATALTTEALSGRRHAELYATLILTPIFFIFAEMIPKDLFRRRADSLMYLLAGPMDVFRVITKPVTAGLRALVLVLTGGTSGRRRGIMFSRTALTEWIAEGRREGVLSDYQHALTANVMELLNKRVLPAMIPLDQAKMVPAELTGDDLRRALREAAHSRVPVFRGSRKNVVGILHAVDSICAVDDNPTAEQLARPALEVRPRDGIHAVLVALQRERQQMALVVNRDGQPSGIVTVKDLVEEIVGELQDF